MKTFKEFILEMGAGGMGGSAGPTVTTGVSTSTDPVSATAVNRKRKRTPVMLPMATRK